MMLLEPGGTLHAVSQKQHDDGMNESFCFHIIQSSIMSVKGFYGGLTLLRDAITAEHLVEGDENDLDVNPQAEVIYIPHI